VLTAFGDGFHAACLGHSEDGHGVAADVDGGVDGDDDLVTTGHTTRTIGAGIGLGLGCGVDDVDDGGAVGGGRAEDRHRVAADVDGRVDGDDDLVTTGHTTRTIGLGEGFRGVCGFLFQDLDDLDTLGFGDPSDGDCVATGIDGRVDGDDDLVTTGHTTRTIGLGERGGEWCGDQAGGEDRGEGVTERIAHGAAFHEVSQGTAPGFPEPAGPSPTTAMRRGDPHTYLE